MFIRKKIVYGHVYYQVVEGYRDEAGKVRHRTIASLARHPTVAEAVAADRAQIREFKRDLDAIGYPFPPGVPQCVLEAGAILVRWIEWLEWRVEKLVEVRAMGIS